MVGNAAEAFGLRSMCGSDLVGNPMKSVPLDGVAKMVKPTEQQRDALEQIRSAALNEFGIPCGRMS